MVQIDAAYPLSPLQQGMLFHGLKAPRSGVDIEQMLWDLPEALVPALLRRAWEQVVTRHEVLRTAFRWQGLAEPQQEVARDVTVPWTQLDWRDVSPADRSARIAAFLAADRTRGFELDRPPLLRLTLIQFSDTQWKLVWTFHHAILDGRSFVTVVQEVFAIYAAARENNSPALAAPVSFRAHVEWLRDHNLRFQAAAESFWRATLKGFSAPTPLTVDRPPAVSAREGGGAHALKRTLSGGDTTALRELAATSGTTLGALLQAAWAILLSRYSGQRDIVFGVTRACRRDASPGAEAAVGLFINTLPLRLDVDPDRPLGEWLRDARTRWDALRSYEHTPLPQVRAWSEVDSGQPLFETLVVFENHQLDEKLRALGGAWRDRSFDLVERTNFPLTLAGYGGTQLALTLQFDARRIDEATAERLLGHVITLLAALPSFARRRVRDLPLLTPEERDALLLRSGSREAHFPPGATLVSWFEAQAGRTPDRIAVVCDTTEGVREELTYAELNARANRLAYRLQGYGVGPDRKVGLFLDRSVDLVVGVLGILKAGGAYVPMDTSSPRERLTFMIDDAALAVIVTASPLVEKLPAAAACPLLQLDASAAEETPANNPGIALSPENLAYVIYTSGSTGQPKGALVTHHNVVRLFRGCERLYDFGADDVWTLFHSIAFDFSVWELFGALLYGGRLVVVPWLVSRSPERFHALLAREQVTVLNQTPSAFRQLIHADAAAPHGTALALRYVIFGGEALELSHLAPWFARHGDQRPQLVNMYGITETTVHVTHRPLRAADLSAGSVIGAPLPDLQLYLLDEDLRPVPIGVPGELYVGGEGLARGYHHRPELTAARFIENPFLPGLRLYRTGDRARWLPNHDIEYLGRLDQQVKIRGHRIELGEIEAALARHPAVRDAVVLARDDAGDRRLVAYIVPSTPAAATSDFRSFLQPHLPEYMIPSAFMRLERLPLTENGKLDRRALPAPEPQRPELATPFVAPQTPTEHAVAAVWREVLHVTQVGVNDNFFELGGNSLRLVQLLGRLSGLSPKPLQIAELFQFPTIRALAIHLQAAAPATSRLLLAQQRASRQTEALRRRSAEKMETVS